MLIGEACKKIGSLLSLEVPHQADETNAVMLITKLAERIENGRALLVCSFPLQF